MATDAVTPTSAAAPTIPRPVDEVRALRRAGWRGSRDVLSHLLQAIDDPLDRETAGHLLLRPGTQESLVAEGFVPTSVAVLASSTVTGLGPLIATHLAARGVAAVVAGTDYDRWEEQALGGGGSLAAAAPRVSVLLLDDEVVFGRVSDPLDPSCITTGCAALVERVTAWVAGARREWGGHLVLATVPLSSRRRAAVRDFGRRNRIEAAWLRMNAALLDLGSEPSVSILSLETVAAAVPAEATARARLTSSQVHSAELFDRVALEVAAVADADLGRSRKVLILDLDDTLWGGVVGDDGQAGLTLGGGFPGNAFSSCQQVAADLERQGVLLTLCSKNDASVAAAAIAEHPEMVLRPGSFVEVVADWNSKPSNVAELAGRLDVGVDSMVFLDDNAVERALMRQLQPTVTTLEVRRPEDHADALLRSRLFDTLAASDEDGRRTSLYRERAEREHSRGAAASLTDFLLDLGTTVDICELDELNRDRIVQLFGKTNQFNLTGRRYGGAQLTALTTAGHLVLGVRVTDRFGDNGLAAALVVHRAPGQWHIDNVVLSCRVFTRDIERAVVGEVLRAARSAGAASVTAEYVPTLRNARFSDFYASLSFAEIPWDGDVEGRPAGAVGWVHGLDGLELPPWVRVRQPLASPDVTRRPAEPHPPIPNGAHP